MVEQTDRQNRSIIMRIWILIGFLLAAVQGFAAPDRIIADIDFNKHSAVLNLKDVGTFTGPLPRGMSQDFTGWSPGVCRTEPLVDNFGDAFLRFHIEKSGVQLNFRLPGLKSKELYKVTFIVRNQLSGALKPYLRKVEPPYNSLKLSFNIPRSETVRTLTFPFSPENVPVEGSAGLFMHFSLPGSADFKRIRVEKISRQEYDMLEQEKLKQIKRKPVGTVNFLRNSTLPKGLQSGWNQLAENHQSRSIVEPDPSVIGPSGEAALKLDSSTDESVGIASEPFVASAPDRKVTVSFAYKGTGDFSASVQTPWSRSRQVLKPRKEEWQRASITLLLPPKRLACVLQIAGRGKLHVDAFRVAEQGEADYKPSGEHEISLFLPESDASISRIQFEDEAPVLNYYVTGKADDVTVKSSVTDLYGNTTVLPESKGKNGTIRYHRGSRPYGQFRVEVQAFRNGKPVSVINEMVVTRLPRPVYWGKDAPESPFGIHMNQLESSIRAMKAGGFNWMRLHDGARHLSCWYFVEPEPGKWKFADKEIKAYRDNHLMLYGQLGGAPAWATELRNLPDFRSEYTKVYFTPLPQYEKDFANYCKVITARYKGVIDDWFIWNEPWGRLFFHKSYDSKKKEYITHGSVKDNAKVYTRYSKLAYTAAKQGNPQCRVTGINSYSTRPDWNSTIYHNGGYDFCDEIDWHVYYQDIPSGYPGDGLKDRMESAFDEIIRREGGLTKPYIMSEGQAGSASVEETEQRIGLYKNTITWHSMENSREIAESNIRYLLSHLSFGVKRVFLYTSHSYQNMARGSGLQIMLGADGFPHPGLVAMSAFAKRIEDRKFVRWQTLADGVYAALFSNGKQTTAVITGELLKKADIVCRGNFPFQLADLYGNPIPALNYKGSILYITADCAPETLAAALRVK